MVEQLKTSLSLQSPANYSGHQVTKSITALRTRTACFRVKILWPGTAHISCYCPCWAGHMAVCKGSVEFGFARRPAIWTLPLFTHTHVHRTGRTPSVVFDGRKKGDTEKTRTKSVQLNFRPIQEARLIAARVKHRRIWGFACSFNPKRTTFILDLPSSTSWDTLVATLRGHSTSWTVPAFLPTAARPTGERKRTREIKGREVSQELGCFLLPC